MKSGIKIAYGHTFVELPLIILLGIGAISLQVFPQSREYIAVFGAISLFAFAALQIRGVYTKSASEQPPKHSPFFIGIVFSALNPFFLIWWFTIGFKLISDALALYSFIGIAVVFGFHIWMDYAWLAWLDFCQTAERSSFLLKTTRFS